MTKKNRTIIIKNESISITADDYISLTDMLKAKDGDFFISDWLRNRNTVEYLGIWERIHNPDFNYGEFATIKSSAGLNSYKISVKEWVKQTNAIGLTAKAGRYGGTYAHKDIAFEFAMWISAEFKIYLIKEFQRLKDQEQDKLGNIRDYSNTSQLVCLANLENLNSVLIYEKMPQNKRLKKLTKIAIQQMQILSDDEFIKKLEQPSQ